MDNLIIKCGASEITFSDLDKDKEIEVEIRKDDENLYLWLNEQQIRQLQDHLTKVIIKLKA